MGVTHRQILPCLYDGLTPEYLTKLDESTKPEAISPMPSFNDTMTITQLTDIVTVLHSQHQQAPPAGVDHPYYAP